MAYRADKKADVSVDCEEPVVPAHVPAPVPAPTPAPAFVHGPPRSVQEIEMLPAFHPLDRGASRSVVSLSNSDTSEGEPASAPPPPPGLQNLARSIAPAPEAQRGLLWRMLMCFSLLGSVRTLLSPRKGQCIFCFMLPLIQFYHGMVRAYPEHTPPPHVDQVFAFFTFLLLVLSVSEAKGLHSALWCVYRYLPVP